MEEIVLEEKSWHWPSAETWSKLQAPKKDFYE